MTQLEISQTLREMRFNMSLEAHVVVRDCKAVGVYIKTLNVYIDSKASWSLFKLGIC